MANVLVLLATSASPRQIDVPDPQIARSVEGSLHFRPGATREITLDELGFIEANHPDLLAKLKVIRDLSRQTAKAEPVSEPDTMPVAIEPHESRSRSKKKRKYDD